jgi:V-type H+-transporting ATPase subunit G
LSPRCAGSGPHSTGGWLILTLSCTQHTSQTSSSQSTIDAQTKDQLAEIEKAIAQNRDAVIRRIVERVTKSEPRLHQNLKKVEA